MGYGIAWMEYLLHASDYQNADANVDSAAYQYPHAHAMVILSEMVEECCGSEVRIESRVLRHNTFLMVLH